MADYETDKKFFQSEGITNFNFKILSKTTKETITITDLVIELVFEKLLKLKWPPSLINDYPKI